MFLVIDDLALELFDHPIFVPIPPNVLKGPGDAALRKFTLKVLNALMKLPFYTWTHHPRNVVIDGFYVRHSSVYPSFST
jgi:hypothetical protein